MMESNKKIQFRNQKKYSKNFCVKKIKT